jgi:hypothetical protein
MLFHLTPNERRTLSVLALILGTIALALWASVP